MAKILLDEFLKATSGTLVSKNIQEFSQISADSRDSEIQKKLFIPLVGEIYDAHKFVTSAVDNGAAGVVVHRWDSQWDDLKSKTTFIQVDDTLKALQDFAHFWRKKFDVKVIGITGSNGKTTTKDFTSQLLKNSGKTCFSEGSFNNHWGVPFTLLNINENHKYCVLEMGMNHPGELEKLSAIGEPDIVVVSNVGRAHVGHFKDVNEIAEAKKEIYRYAPVDSMFVFNLDNPWTLRMRQEFLRSPHRTYSLKEKSADVYFEIVKKETDGFQIKGSISGVFGKAKISIWGEQNIENLAAACCLSVVAGVSGKELWDNLHKVNTGWGRNQWLDLKSGGRLIFDGYNANPDSFLALIENLKGTFPAFENKVAVFGEMLELGEESSELHRQLGELCGGLDWDQIYFIGPSGKDFLKGWKASENSKSPVILNTYKQSLDIELASMVHKHTLVVVKGSRGGALERVVDRFLPVDFTHKS